MVHKFNKDFLNFKCTSIHQKVSLLLLQLFFIFDLLLLAFLSCALTLNDNGLINSTVISKVLRVSNEDDILKAIKCAQGEHLQIAIMAIQHSQGGSVACTYGDSVRYAFIQYHSKEKERRLLFKVA